MERKRPRKAGASEFSSPAVKSLTAARLSWLERCSLDRTVTALELRLAIQLALKYVSMPRSSARYDSERVPVAWPPQATLAATLACSRQAISSAARRLSRRGYINLNAGGGRGNATEYSLVIKGNTATCLLAQENRQSLPAERAKAGPAMRKDPLDKRQSSSLPHSLSYIPNNHTQSHSQSDGRDFSGRKREGEHPEFDEIFEFWPNPDKHRGKSFGAWKNYVIRPREQPARVLKRAKQWCAYWAAEGISFIPYLGKWIAEEQWEEPPPGTPREVAEMLSYFEARQNVSKSGAQRIKSEAEDDEEEVDDRRLRSRPDDGIYDPYAD